MMLQKYLIIMFSFLLAACASKVEEVYIEKRVYVPIEIADYYFEVPKMPPPPAKDVFIELSNEEAITVLSKYAMNLQRYGANLRKRISDIKSDIETQYQGIKELQDE